MNECGLDNLGLVHRRCSSGGGRHDEAVGGPVVLGRSSGSIVHAIGIGIGALGGRGWGGGMGRGDDIHGVS